MTAAVSQRRNTDARGGLGVTAALARGAASPRGDRAASRACSQRAAGGKILPGLAPGRPAGAWFATTEFEGSALVSALWSLAPREREALVLLYYADLPEAQIASVMGISKGAVKNHTARAMSSLRAELRRAGP